MKMRIAPADLLKLFFCSDLHYGHDKDFLFKPRGFADREEHMRFLRNGLAALPPDALVINLGDFCLTCDEKSFREFLFVNQVRWVYLNGNHNAIVNQWRANPPADNLVGFAGDYLEITADKQMIVCFHYPMKSWNSQSRGAWHFHGHVHGAYPESSPFTVNDGKILDVGVENAIKYNGTPFFSFADVCKIMNAKKQVGDGAHH
jgi:calcineurin-like phosphoesterase family protein